MNHNDAYNLDTLSAQADAFWQAWAEQAPQFNALSATERVEAGNALLHQYFDGVILELQENSPRDMLIFSANGVLDHFIAIDILINRATTRDYDLAAFRQPLPAQNIADFIIRMQDELELAAGDLLVSAQPNDQLIDLEVTINKKASEDQQTDLQNMAFILLDHILGEWHFAVRIRGVEFSEHAKADAVPASNLPALIDALWHDSLGHDGNYPDADTSKWAAAKCEETAEQDALVLVRNESAAALLGRPDMAWCVIIDSELTAQEDLSTAQDLEEYFYNTIAQDQRGIGVLSIVNFTQGVRSIFAYCRHPEHGLAAAQSALAAFPELSSQVRSDYDPAWQWYQF